MTVEHVLSIARTQIGVTESPAGSNKTKYGAWYGLDGNPWCAMFVSWCFMRAGLVGLVDVETPKGFHYTPRALARFKEEGRGVPKYEAKPGDIVFFQFDSDPQVDHVGIVESVSDRGLVCIEGNTSISGSQSNGGAVLRRPRDWGLVAGVVRPAWPVTVQPAGGDDPETDEMVIVRQGGNAFFLLGNGRIAHIAKTETLQEAINSGIKDVDLSNDLATFDNIKKAATTP